MFETGKQVSLCHNYGKDVQDTDVGKVDELWLYGEVDGITEPGDKLSHNQYSYSQIIKTFSEWQ